MENVDRGKHIISVAKALKQFKAADFNIAASLSASFFAGRAGLLASAFRYQKVSMPQASALAAPEGLTPHDLKTTVLPWLENAGLCQVMRKRDGTVATVQSVVLTYDNILSAVSDLYDSLEPTPQDRGCVSLVGLVSSIPLPQSEVLHVLALQIGQQHAQLAITLAKSFLVVDYKEGRGLTEPILYSSRLWASCIDRAAKALTTLTATDRAVLLELVSQVRGYQGMPRSQLEAFAIANGAAHLLKIAIGVRLIHETRIEMATGQSRAFLTTPHFYEEIANQHGDDVCDRVKIFLDSVRNGQHFGDQATGRILNPERLLNRLLVNRQIGPCTAIGTDYITSEKAGIVKVTRVSEHSPRCFLELVQEDTVKRVYEVITRGTLDTTIEMAETHVQEGRTFKSIEECQPERGKAPANVAEAERAIMLQLREGI